MLVDVTSPDFVIGFSCKNEQVLQMDPTQMEEGGAGESEGGAVCVRIYV